MAKTQQRRPRTASKPRAQAGTVRRTAPRTGKADPFDAVRRLARGLPDVEETNSWGQPTLKVGGRMFACIASHKSAEPGTLVVRIPFAQRDEMIAESPEIYYLKEHYVNYACVLVRLSRVPPDALRDLLLSGWRFIGENAGRTRRPSARRR
jgi:hypothetical protein